MLLHMLTHRKDRTRYLVAAVTGRTDGEVSRLPSALSERRGRAWRTRGIVLQGARRRSGRVDGDIFHRGTGSRPVSADSRAVALQQPL